MENQRRSFFNIGPEQMKLNALRGFGCWSAWLQRSSRLMKSFFYVFENAKSRLMKPMLSNGQSNVVWCEKTKRVERYYPAAESRFTCCWFYANIDEIKDKREIETLPTIKPLEGQHWASSYVERSQRGNIFVVVGVEEAEAIREKY